MKIIDLTKTIYNGMEVYPGDPEVLIHKVSTINKDKWNVSKLSMGSHTGTHADAFSHMIKGANSIDNITLDYFIGHAFAIRSTEKHPLSDGIIYYSGIINYQNLEIAKNKKYKFIGIDSGCSFSAEIEKEFLKENIITITDLVNTKRLPKATSFVFIAAPLKISGCDGSPVRAIAITDI